MTQIKIGDAVTPIVFPQLKGKVEKISTFFGETIYVLESGGWYTKNELV
jgi:hypothetical protein